MDRMGIGEGEGGNMRSRWSPDSVLEGKRRRSGGRIGLQRGMSKRIRRILAGKKVRDGE